MSICPACLPTSRLCTAAWERIPPDVRGEALEKRIRTQRRDACEEALRATRDHGHVQFEPESLVRARERLDEPAAEEARPTDEEEAAAAQILEDVGPCRVEDLVELLGRQPHAKVFLRMLTFIRSPIPIRTVVTLEPP